MVSPDASALRILESRLAGRGDGIPLRDFAEINAAILAVPTTQLREAAELIAKGIKGRMRGILVASVYSRWAESDPDSALAHLSGSDSSSFVQREGLQGLFSAWVVSDSDAAIAAMQSLPGGLKTKDVASGVLRTIAQNAPLKAIELAPLFGQDTHEQMMPSIASYLGWGDPNEVEAWLETIDDPEHRGKMLANAINGWAAAAPREAIRFALAEGNSKARDGSISNAYASWASAEPDKAFTSFIDEREQIGSSATKVIDYMVRSLMITGDELTIEQAREINSQLPSDDLQHAFVSRFARERVGKVPDEAVELASTLPEGSTRQDTFKQIAFRWANSDAPSASEWIADLPTGRSREVAIVAFSNELADSDPENAATWAATLPNPHERDLTLGKILQDWTEEDPAAADVWRKENADLSADP